MQDNVHVENWCGHDIRFIEYRGDWWAILKDVCDALGLRVDGVSNRLDPDMLERVCVDVSDPSSNGVRSSTCGNVRSRGQNKTRWMLAINEIGIYEALFASRKLEARKFRRWAAEVMQQLRVGVGLKDYEVFKMTEPEVQQTIDEWLFENTFFRRGDRRDGRDKKRRERRRHL